MGSASVKIYDKVGQVLRIETTANDASFFKHPRKVEHKNGTETRELAPLKKSIYSLIDLREILLGCNRRYLGFLSSLDGHSDGQRALQKLTEPKTRRPDLKPYLRKLAGSSLSRQIKRLQLFGMTKRVPGAYRCYLTKLGRAATAACVHATEFTILPALATVA